MISLCEATLTSELNSSLTVCFLPTEEREKYPFRLARREWGGGGERVGVWLWDSWISAASVGWLLLLPKRLSPVVSAFKRANRTLLLSACIGWSLHQWKYCQLLSWITLAITEPQYNEGFSWSPGGQVDPAVTEGKTVTRCHSCTYCHSSTHTEEGATSSNVWHLRSPGSRHLVYHAGRKRVQSILRMLGLEMIYLIASRSVPRN